MLGAEIKLTFLSPSLGGRIPPSAFSGGLYRPHFRVGAAGEYLGVAFLRGPENSGPDSEIDATVALIYDVDYSALQPGTQFQVLEGAACVATGRVVRRFEIDADWRQAGRQSA